MRRFKCLSMGLLLIMALTACSSQGSSKETTEKQETEAVKTTAESATETSGQEASEPLSITFVTPLLGNPVWLTAKQGAEDAAAEIGTTTNWVRPSEIDMDEQVSQIELARA